MAEGAVGEKLRAVDSVKASFACENVVFVKNFVFSGGEEKLEDFTNQPVVAERSFSNLADRSQHALVPVFALPIKKLAIL